MKMGCIDVGFNGSNFTLRNNRVGISNIRQTLDRIIFNDQWRIIFPKAGVTHLLSIKLEHDPLVLKLRLESTRKPYPFGFEDTWTRDSESYKAIDSTWNTHLRGSTFIFSKKVKKALNMN